MVWSEEFELRIRGLRYFVRARGPTHGPTAILLHGLLDNSAGFTPLAEALPDTWRVIAPDWRGHGNTDWVTGGYWFPDYVADLDALIAQLSPTDPVVLIGHSMGGQAGSLFAGLRPRRVRRLICLDSLAVPETTPERLHERYREWLTAESHPPHPRRYASKSELADRIGRRYPELDARAVAWLARIWSQPAADGNGIRLAVDPRHFVPFPIAFHPDEAMATWRQVAAPVLCIDGNRSPARKLLSATEHRRRRQAFPDYTEHMLDGAGHMLHVQFPCETANRIRAFVASDEPQNPLRDGR